MNPLCSRVCALRWLGVLALFSSLIVAAGCGSGGGPIPSLGGGFSNGSLKGQYVISQTGIGINQSVTGSDPFSETIVFTADGNGKLTIPVDDFEQSGAAFGLSSPISGTYKVKTDGTGSLSFNGSNYAITMIDGSHFYVIEGDTFATASGYGEKQTAFSAVPSGNFVFKAHNLNTSSRVGGINITSGAISGNEDLLVLSQASIAAVVSSVVSMTTPDSNGKGLFVLNDGSRLNYYVVNAGKFYIMANNGGLEIGQAEAQSGSFSLATLAAGTSYVFGSAGDTMTSGTAGIHSGGVFTSDGNGNLTAGTVDYVQDTTVNSNLAVASGSSYTLASSGRGQISLQLSGGFISPQIFWMVSSSPARAYFLTDSNLAVEDGTFTLQQGAPFSSLSSSTHAAFVMDGFDIAYKDRVGAFAPTSGTQFNWNQIANSFDAGVGLGTVSAVSTNGTVTVTSNGRVAVSINGVTTNLVFYLSAPNTGVMVQEDAQIGGSFTAQ